mgnify:CR=1 FL=1
MIAVQSGKESMPKINIIIPVYNTEKYLRRCLDSVFAQTFRDFEVICVNDCSQDASLSILREYEKMLSGKMTVIENEKNIVTTHALIQKMDLDMLELLKSKEYILMIDECLDVLSPYKISKDDVKIIFNEHLVSLDDDGFLVWNEDKKPYKGVYGDIKRLCSFK